MEQNANVTSTIIDTINAIFDELFSSIDMNLYKILDDLTFINENILADKNFEKIFGTSASNGILLITNSLLIGFILYFSIRYFSSNFTFTKIENPGQFILKIIIFGICMNSSYFIVGQILNINSNISLAVRSIGEDLFNKNVSFSGLIENINKNLNFVDSNLNIFSVDGIIKGTTTISLLNLVVVYAIRYITIKILVLFSPFAILTLSLNNTKWIFVKWIKSLCSLLIIQIIVSIVLLILFSIDYTDGDLMTKFIYVGGIYALIRANSLAKEFIM